MGLSVTRNITVFIIILLFLDVRGMSSWLPNRRLVRSLTGAGSQSARRLSDRAHWPAADAQVAEWVNLVYDVVQTDPCLEYQQRKKRSMSRTSSQGSARSSRDSQPVTPDDRNTAFQRCVSAGAAYRSLGASWKPECVGAVGAECKKKGGKYNCYLKMGSRSGGLGAFGCFGGGGGGPKEKTFPECTGYITRYKTQQNLVNRMATYGH
ncbi:uncharacterized protein [Bemisia tabaci]|uniref:uncharacterized protein n=1 Tax=Bemisia tabaci TaxID=7038 RepID=UPI003B282E07